MDTSATMRIAFSDSSRTGAVTRSSSGPPRPNPTMSGWSHTVMSALRQPTAIAPATSVGRTSLKLSITNSETRKSTTGSSARPSAAM